MPVPAGDTPYVPPLSGPLFYDPVVSRVRLTVPVPIVLDTFTRSLFPDWGTSDSGHVWTTSGGSGTDYSVDGAQGAINLTTAGVTRETQLALSYADVDITVVHLKVPATPTGETVDLGMRARYVDANNFVEVRLFLSIADTVTIAVRQVVGGVETVAGFPTVPGVTATTALSVRLQAMGATLRAKAWQKGLPEPSAWNVSMTATHLTAGGFRNRAIRYVGNTNTPPYVVEFDGLAITPTMRVERSTDGVNWSTVRGGVALTPVADEVKVDDYEFSADVENFYRVGSLFSGSLTPVLGGVWLKNLRNGALNRKVTVKDLSPIAREARAGIFGVVGARNPVAVTDVRGGNRYTLQVRTDSTAEAEAVNALLDDGGVLLVHVPTTGRLSAVPSLYAIVGDTGEEILPTLDLQPHVIALPLTQVDAPPPEVVGVSVP